MKKFFNFIFLFFIKMPRKHNYKQNNEKIICMLNNPEQRKIIEIIEIFHPGFKYKLHGYNQGFY
jgi:hypothetical protein